MKIILTMEIPDDLAKKEGITLEDLKALGVDMERELKQGLPDGTIFSVRVTP